MLTNAIQYLNTNKVNVSTVVSDHLSKKKRNIALKQ